MRTKLVRGDTLRKTRFHDEKGNRIDPTGSLFLPLSLVQSALRISIGYRPSIPWISWRAIDVMNQLITKESKVLEFGSGMSTIWLARRCDTLHSIEDDQYWFYMIRDILATNRFANVRYELRGAENYSDISEYPDSFFDFILIDGAIRDSCARAAILKVKSGGWIYLDNTDKDMTVLDGAMRNAEAILLQAVSDRGGSVRYFVDFAPAQIFVSEGALVRL